MYLVLTQHGVKIGLNLDPVAEEDFQISQFRHQVQRLSVKN